MQLNQINNHINKNHDNLDEDHSNQKKSNFFPIAIMVENCIGWLQGQMIHFLHHNDFFCKFSCIYILLTCHKISNMPKILLDLNYQLE
jgi:hypothetical protein